MTSPSDKQQSTENHNQPVTDKVCNQVNKALDNSAFNLSASTLSDLAKIRAVALKELNKKSQINHNTGNLFNNLINKISSLSLTTIAMPVAAAFIIAISVNDLSQQSIPQIPLAMINSSIPNEDLAMLEDLEFVIWLAENKTDVLL